MTRLPKEYPKKQLVYEVKMRSKRRPTITYRLHAQRAMLVPSIMLRRGYLEKVHLAQIQSEKDAILSHIGRLQPGVRDEYLRQKQRWRIHRNLMDTINAKGGGWKDDVPFHEEMDFRNKLIQYDVDAHDRLQLGKHADDLQNRYAALTDRIPKKAIGL